MSKSKGTPKEKPRRRSGKADKIEEARRKDKSPLQNAISSNPVPLAPADSTTGPSNEEVSPTDSSTEITRNIVREATDAFFRCAWNICSERYYNETQPAMICWDLRNTWLRLMDAEWQEPSIFANLSTKPNKVFQAENAPLPLVLDGWSRGGLEQLPENRRESVMDPFQRDVFVATIVDKTKDIEGDTTEAKLSVSDKTSNISLNVHPERTSRENAPYHESQDRLTSASDVSASNGDEWNFDLDNKSSLVYRNSVTPESLVSPDDTDYMHQLESACGKTTQDAKSRVQTILRARSISSKFSMEDEYFMAELSKKNQMNAIPNAVKIGNYSNVLDKRLRSETFQMSTPRSSDDGEAERSDSLSENDSTDNATKERESLDSEVRELFIEEDKQESVSDNFSEEKTFAEIDVASTSLLTDRDQSYLRRQLMNLRIKFNKQAFRNCAAMKKSQKGNDKRKPFFLLPSPSSPVQSKCSSRSSSRRLSGVYQGSKVSESTKGSSDLRMRANSQKTMANVRSEKVLPKPVFKPVKRLAPYGIFPYSATNVVSYHSDNNRTTSNPNHIELKNRIGERKSSCDFIDVNDMTAIRCPRACQCKDQWR